MPFEKNLSNWLMAGARSLIAEKRLHLCRVENSAIPGYPDIEGCLDWRTFHIELKGAIRPARPRTPVRVKFQPRQKPWLNRRWAVGGSCFVLLRVGVGRDIRRYLICGNDDVEMVGGVSEDTLEQISIVQSQASGADIIRAAAFWRSQHGA